MKIFYWAPWIGNIGTIKAVLNSAFIMEHYSKNKIQTKIINSVGEWDNFEEKDKMINIRNFKFYKYLPQGGFFKSRLTYIIILSLVFCLLKTCPKGKTGLFSNSINYIFAIIFKNFF